MKMTKVQDSNNQKLIFFPPLSSKIDPLSISSLSIERNMYILITQDKKIKAMGDNTNGNIDNSLPKRQLDEFIEFEIKDEWGAVWYPISAHVTRSYILYLVSESENSIKTRIAYIKTNGKSKITFFNTSNSCPVAIFTGSLSAAAIDMQGGIIDIPVLSSSDFLLKDMKTYYLPNGEKAVEIAIVDLTLFVLSSNGKLFKSKEKKDSDVDIFSQVKQFKNKKVVHISGSFHHLLVLTGDGIVYSYGLNTYGQLGIVTKKAEVNKFTEIDSLKKYEIKAVYAGYKNSVFQTKNGKILVCGYIEFDELITKHKIHGNKFFVPVETPIENADYCILSSGPMAFYIGLDEEMLPRRNIKNRKDIKIILIGDKIKKEILNIFTQNKFNESFVDENKDEHDIILKIDQSTIKLTLIDLSCFDEDHDMRIKNLQRANNILLFYDLSNLSSFNDSEKLYGESKRVWSNDLNLAIVAFCDNFNSTEENQIINKNRRYLNEKGQRYKCKVFEIKQDDMASINEPFYYFLNVKENFKKEKEIIKLGKEHENPFLKIKNDHINIGLFGSSNVNKTEISFKYIFEDMYIQFYEDYVQNFVDIDLTKIVEVHNQIVTISLIDSTFVNDIDDSFYSAIQGSILFFNVEIIFTDDFINEIEQFYIKIIGSPLVIALVGNDIHQDLINEKIKPLEKLINFPVFLITTQTNENIEEMFYCLTKKIIQNTKQNEKSLKKKKHHKKKY